MLQSLGRENPCRRKMMKSGMPEGNSRSSSDSSGPILALALIVVLVAVTTVPIIVAPTFCAPTGSIVFENRARVCSVAQVLDDVPPVANAGLTQNVTIGELVTFDGSLSTGFEGPSNLNYTWNFTTLGVKQSLYGPNPTFVFNKTGAYKVNLTVRDSLGRTSWAEVYIVVRETPKTFLEQYWGWLLVIGAAVIVSLPYAIGAIRRFVSGQPIVSETGRDKTRLFVQRSLRTFKTLMKNRMGALGMIILSIFVFLAIFGPAIAPYKIDVFKVDLENAFLRPSESHWLGTDNNGLDIFSELLYGARTSIIVGVFAAVIASILGAAIGLYSGYVGGWRDELIMRLNDIVLSIPWLVLMIVVAALLGQIDLTGIILIIGLTGWSMTARMVRAQVLSIRERQYIERARSIGASDMDIIRRHVFPNAFPLIFANTILTVAVSILSEATLSFLGLRPAGVITWGTMLSYAYGADAFSIGLQGWILAPGMCIVVIVLGFTLLGFALDEILNPKLKAR